MRWIQANHWLIRVILTAAPAALAVDSPLEIGDHSQLVADVAHNAVLVEAHLPSVIRVPDEPDGGRRRTKGNTVPSMESCHQSLGIAPSSRGRGAEPWHECLSLWF